jgi:hypothetical protein
VIGVVEATAADAAAIVARAAKASK